MESERCRTCGWSVFDVVKPPLPPTPDALMGVIDAAIATTEHARATLTSPASKADEQTQSSSSAAVYDVRTADEAYKAARAALAAGRPDDALRSLHVALSSCPPNRPSALSKLRSLLSIASSHQQNRQLEQ